MNKNDVLTLIKQTGLVAILRKLPPDVVEPTVEALIAGGVRAVEITVDSPHAMELIRMLNERFGDDIAVGAGTVLDSATAREAVAAGADFLLSPGLNVEMVKTCQRYGKLAVPGVMTPTEIIAALEAGADLIKLFPVGPLGAGYIKDVLGPLSQAALLPTGGITMDNAKSFVKAGAAALGLGGSLVNTKTAAQKEFAAVKKAAAKFVRIVAEARQEMVG